MEHEDFLIYNHLGADAWNSVHLHKKHKNDTFAENWGEAGGNYVWDYQNGLKSVSQCLLLQCRHKSY